MKKKNKLEMPKDLGLKIGTAEEVYWTDIKKKCEDLILAGGREIVIHKNMLALAERKIAEESGKLK